MPTSTGTENKNTGSFYTPEWCVDILLSMSGFSNLDAHDLIASNIIDPACGDGAILSRAADIAISKMLDAGYTDGDISQWIRNSICGIELDAAESRSAQENISSTAAAHGITVSLDDIRIECASTFDVLDAYKGHFDYVIGNPPYVRIHNLDEKPDSPYITGMCDLYYAFYDLGLQMLVPDGRLCFISPISWMTNEAGAAMRQDLQCESVITDVLDFAHFQVFPNATTYTGIIAMNAKGHPATDGNINIWNFDEETLLASPETTRPQADMWCGGKFYASDISGIRELLSFDAKHAPNPKNIAVRNGYATMCDKAFISDSGFDGCEAYEIDIIKASKGKRQKAIYPHGRDGKPVTWEDIEKNSPACAERLLEWKDKLLARNRIDVAHWWAYGRTQGIVDTYCDKVTVQSIVKPGRDIVIVDAPAGTGVYSGLYVLGMSSNELTDAVSAPAFMDYMQALGKYKSGGYYSYSGKELEKYLVWWDSRQMFSELGEDSQHTSYPYRNKIAQ